VDCEPQFPHQCSRGCPRMNQSESEEGDGRGLVPRPSYTGQTWTGQQLWDSYKMGGSWLGGRCGGRLMEHDCHSRGPGQIGI
jgi:hypothetical protein